MKKTTFAAALTLAACAGSNTAAPPPAAAPAAAPAEDGFTALFDGASTDGWKQAGPGRMVIENGVARTEGGMGLWYYEKKPFKDFVLRLQFRQLRPDANAGVFVRFPRVDGDPWVPVKEGYEIQIASNKAGDKHATGSVYSFKAPDALASRPAGEWNDYEIQVVGQEYRITLNGQLVNTFKGERATEGMVGLQNHGDKDVVEFRNVRVKEL